VLIWIKVLHTLIWACMAAGILALPVLGLLRRFRWAAILSAVILLECIVLALNGGRCPLTELASRFTPDRAPNFDIYLPNWLAQYNKIIFGALFIAGELVVLGYWLRERALSSRRRALSQTLGASRRGRWPNLLAHG
jgi:hypothetical protein